MSNLYASKCSDLFEECVSFRHLADGAQRVLHDAHDGSVGLRRDDHAGHGCQLSDLGAGLERLGQMEIHLVSVEVSVVRSRHTEKRVRCFFLSVFNLGALQRIFFQKIRDYYGSGWVGPGLILNFFFFLNRPKIALNQGPRL